MVPGFLASYCNDTDRRAQAAHRRRTSDQHRPKYRQVVVSYNTVPVRDSTGTVTSGVVK